MRRYFSLKLKVLFLCLLSISAFSNAAVVSVMGDDVVFTYDDATQFGTATVVGNSIFFFNPVFNATSVGTAGTVIDTDFVAITIETKQDSDFVMDNFTLFELGDYDLDGDSASVSADAQLIVSSLTGACPFPCTMSNVFSAGALTTQGALTEWQINGGLDLDNDSSWGEDTAVNLTIQNTLTAESTVFGDSAFIVKKTGALGVTVSAEVPVLAAVWLFGSALIGLISARKKRLKVA